MASGLFNPLRAVRPTLEKVGVIQDTLCDGMNQFGMAYPAEIEDQRLAIRKAMLEFKIETSFADDPPSSFQHLSLIIATPPEAGVTTWVEGEKLVSVLLPLAEVSDIAHDAAIAAGVSTESQNVISVLINSGAAWSAAAQAAGVPEWKALITGQVSGATKFAETVQNYLSLAEVLDGSADVMYSNFGVYGEFPFVVVNLSDAMVLMDPLTGNLVGPFGVDTQLDTKSLLLAHTDAYAVGTGLRYYSQLGCTTPVAARWRGPWSIWPTWPTGPHAPRVPGPTPGPIPVIPPWCIGQVPPCPAIPLNPTLPGWPSAWTCTPTGPGGASCTCVGYTIEVSPGPPSRLIWVEHTSICAGVGGICPPPGPMTAPTMPAVAPVAGCGIPSIRTYW